MAADYQADGREPGLLFKGTGVVFGLLLAHFVFGETITTTNMVGPANPHPLTDGGNSVLYFVEKTLGSVGIGHTGFFGGFLHYLSEHFIGRIF